MAARHHVAWRVFAGFISLGAALAPAITAAQSTLATVSGTITDQSGGALPGATVTLTNLATGAERTAVTGGAGEFNLPNVDAGNYVMVIRLQGFADVTRNVELLARQIVRADTQLQIATASEKVEVTAVRSAPVAVLVSVTVAPGRAAWDWSVTPPLTVASVDCAEVMPGASAAPSEMKTANTLHAA